MIFNSLLILSLGSDDSNKQNNPLYLLYSLRKRSLHQYMQGAGNALLKSKEQSYLLCPVEK